MPRQTVHDLVAEAIALHGVSNVLAGLSKFAKRFGECYNSESQVGSNWRVIREVTATLSNLPFPDEHNEGD